MNVVECLTITMLLHNRIFKRCLDDKYREETIQVFLTRAEQLSSTITAEQARPVLWAIQDIIENEPAMAHLLNNFFSSSIELNRHISSLIDKKSDSEIADLPDWSFELPPSEQLETAHARLQKIHRQLDLEETMQFAILFDRDDAPECMQHSKSLLIQHAIDNAEHAKIPEMLQAIEWAINRFPSLEEPFAIRALHLAKGMSPEEALKCFFLMGYFSNSEIRDQAGLALQQSAIAAANESSDAHSAFVETIGEKFEGLEGEACTESFLLQMLPPLLRESAHLFNASKLTSILHFLNQEGISRPELVNPAISALLPRIGQLISQMSVDETASALFVLCSNGFEHDELTHAWAAGWSEVIPNMDLSYWDWPYTSVLQIAGKLHGYDDLARQMVDLMTPQLEKIPRLVEDWEVLSIAVTLRNLHYPHEPLIRFLKKYAIMASNPLDPYPYWISLGSILKEIEIAPVEYVSDDLPDMIQPLNAKDLLATLEQLNKTGHRQGPAAVVPSIKALMPQIMQLSLSDSASLQDITRTLQIVAMYNIEHQELAKHWAAKVTMMPFLDPMTYIGTAGLVKGCDVEMRQVIDLMTPILTLNHTTDHEGIVATTMRNLNYYPEALIDFQLNTLNPGPCDEFEANLWRMFNNMLERGMTPTPSIPSSSHDDLEPPAGKRHRRG